jgi:hypothetical protein
VDLTGPQRFARFAYPPNAHGYCGPDSSDDLLRLATVEPDEELVRLATAFEGAFPYLELLAGANRRTDPLDPDVVEAYWIGNALLENVSTADLGQSIDDRFRRRAGRRWGDLAKGVPTGCANHSFHVLSVSPWVGLLRGGLIDEPLGIIDDCRISWGTVLSADAQHLVVDRSPLVWSIDGLQYGPPAPTTVQSLVPCEIGDVVAIHWGWACETLRPRQIAWLRHVTNSQLSNQRRRL